MSFKKFLYAGAVSLVLASAAPVYAKSAAEPFFNYFLSSLAQAVESIMPQAPLPEEARDGADQDYIDPREVQQVLRETRDLKRELARYRKQLAKLPNSGDDTNSIDSLLSKVADFQQKINSGENLRDTIEEFRSMQIWDELNKFRAKVEVPNEIKQRTKEMKKIETLLRKRATQTIADYFGIDLSGLGAKIADAKAGLAKVQGYYNGGDLENAIEQLDELRQDFQPWDASGVLQRFQEMYNGVKKIKDQQIKDGVKEILADVVLDFNEGEYQSARELLEETAGDLMQLIYPKKYNKEKSLDIIEQLEDKMGKRSSEIREKVKEKEIKRKEVKEEVNKKIEDRKNEVVKEKDKTTICPAMPTVSSCPEGQKMISQEIQGCGTYNTCVDAAAKDSTYKGDTNSCPGFAYSRYDKTGRRYCQLNAELKCDYEYPSYLTNGENYTKAKCPVETSSACGDRYCSSQETPLSCPSDCGSNTTTVPSGQKQQVWNNKGLQSYIRSDADTARIDQLKTACANVSSGMNIWMPGAGTYSSADFGMPDPAKCARAAECTTSQYFDGTSCVSSQGSQNNQTNTSANCGTGQYWDSRTGGCRSSADACREARGTWDSVSNYCNMSGVTNTACNNNGACEYGESQGSCPSDCGSGSSSSASCGSNQYWNGSMCVSSGSSSGSGSTMDPATGCAQAGGTWNSASNYCNMPGTSGSSGGASSCPSGQYWNGTSCVNNTTTSAQPASLWDIIKEIFGF